MPLSRGGLPGLGAYPRQRLRVNNEFENCLGAGPGESARRRVKLIADRTTPCGHNSGTNPLTRTGVPIWIDHGARIAHAKSMVIDGKVTLTGSDARSIAAAQRPADRQQVRILKLFAGENKIVNWSSNGV